LSSSLVRVLRARMDCISACKAPFVATLALRLARGRPGSCCKVGMWVVSYSQLPRCRCTEWIAVHCRSPASTPSAAATDASSPAPACKVSDCRPSSACRTAATSLLSQARSADGRPRQREVSWGAPARTEATHRGLQSRHSNQLRHSSSSKPPRACCQAAMSLAAGAVHPESVSDFKLVS
jgi:hypothetical protein